ncbi:holin family protein [Roseobacter sp. HKCCA0434]|uniref:holin family protein n=1 Tax=Roseobacter sp. HKCCA0434 TaxID=3079297 RepID=UPI002905C23B|nr:holin family protein [Roseobacter sp. HKCCA0434]
MGLSWLGLGTAAKGVGQAAAEVAEVFTVNRTKRAQAEHREQITAMEGHAAEFARAPRTWFDGLIDGLNRLPRPGMAFATMGLFAYAMHDPLGFAARMQGLALVPDPLWWLMGAVVSFYFGARELHHIRGRTAPGTQDAANVMAAVERLEAQRQARAPKAPAAAPPVDNPVIAEWRRETS